MDYVIHAKSCSVVALLMWGVRVVVFQSSVCPVHAAINQTSPRYGASLNVIKSSFEEAKNETNVLFFVSEPSFPLLARV